MWLFNSFMKPAITTADSARDEAAVMQIPPPPAAAAAAVEEPQQEHGHALTVLHNEEFDISQVVVEQVPDVYKKNGLNSNWDTFAVILHNILSAEECKQWIQDTEQAGYSEALVNVGGGKEMKLKDVRNSSRCIIDDTTAAALLWERIKNFVPAELSLPRQSETWEVMELNERLRFLRYDRKEYFAVHMDGSYMRPPDHPNYGSTSQLTLLLYLNEGFEGGGTCFYRKDPKIPPYRFNPRTGSVLIFEHPMLHEGEQLRNGRKYVMRTDVMYGNSTLMARKLADEQLI